MIQILFGHPDHRYYDITLNIIIFFVSNSTLQYPHKNTRIVNWVYDPAPNFVKELIFNRFDKNNKNIIESFKFSENSIFTFKFTEEDFEDIFPDSLITSSLLSQLKSDIPCCYDRLLEIHPSLKIKYGNFSQEFLEQILAILTLVPGDRVFEMGGNIGRNSLIISKILGLCDPKDIQHPDSFHIIFEPDHLSYTRLLENLKCNMSRSLPTNVILATKDDMIVKPKNKNGHLDTKFVPLTNISIDNIEEYELVTNVSTPKEIFEKFKTNFNVLIADCEGYIYYMLTKFPYFLDFFEKIIIENDFEMNDEGDRQAQYVQWFLKQKGFTCVISLDKFRKNEIGLHQFWSK